MKENEIKNLFNEAIQERGVYKKIDVSRDIVYNWKSNKTTPGLAQMLEVLYRLELIKIVKNEV